MFTIEYSEEVGEDLADLRAFDRKQILSQIDAQLTHQPMGETRTKKKLIGLDPPWEHAEPVWELRVGELGRSGSDQFSAISVWPTIRKHHERGRIR